VIRSHAINRFALNSTNADGTVERESKEKKKKNRMAPLRAAQPQASAIELRHGVVELESSKLFAASAATRAASLLSRAADRTALH
jgi:hypothetical protein